MTAADHSKTANSTVANAYHRHAVDLHPETSASLEIIPRHASSTFLAHAEAHETVRRRLDRRILTLLRPSLPSRLFAVALVVVAGEVISNFVVAVVVGEI